MKNLFLIGFLFGFAGAASAQSPAPVHAPTINLEKTPKYPKKIKHTGPVILDARGAFDFATGHIENSVLVRWQDYDAVDEFRKGLLDLDTDLLARKLRISGISPDRQVIVVGKGKLGHGEEGRVAWML